MEVSEFFELFIRELEINKDLHGYYRLLDKPGRLLWRKAYLEQRLRYIQQHLGKPGKTVWDVGCGYGNTSIFAALNGHRVMGSTLEFYFDHIRRRLEYWSRYGDLSGLHIAYENLFDRPAEKQSVDVVIVQDTLHHLEPIDQACTILCEALKTGGRLIVSEENGNNPFIRGKNFATRGFKRVGEIYDERLGKMIPFGNENARSLKAWKKILQHAGFRVVDSETRFIRFIPPFAYNQDNYNARLEQEDSMGQQTNLLTNNLFFGINFIALKK
jgi:2-polyprenyl-3-methyl-5-hydroxy-6-metoxy-1,4-benzoquinol methylase